MANITRDEAIAVLHQLTDSGILSEQMENDLADIRHCISCENDGYHVWGSDGDEIELYIGRNVDLITDEVKAKCQAIHDKYSFTPCPAEKEDFKNFKN